MRKKSLVVLDFDGTLAKIVNEPEKARIGRRELKGLAELARFAEILILTGRPRKFIEPQVKGIPGVKILGLHGNERVKKTKRIAVLEKKAKETVRGTRGLDVEGKRTGFVLHYRNVRRMDDETRRRINRMMFEGRKVAKVLQGRKCLEFLPKNAKTKKDILRALVARNPERRVVFVGDDDSDLGAMRACLKFRNFRGALISSREMRGAMAGSKVKKIDKGALFPYIKQEISGG